MTLQVIAELKIESLLTRRQRYLHKQQILPMDMYYIPIIHMI